MRKDYSPPKLLDYGSATTLTLGASGPNQDYVYSGGALNVDTNAPSCKSNAGGCVHFS